MLKKHLSILMHLTLKYYSHPVMDGRTSDSFWHSKVKEMIKFKKTITRRIETEPCLYTWKRWESLCHYRIKTWAIEKLIPVFHFGLTTRKQVPLCTIINYSAVAGRGEKHYTSHQNQWTFSTVANLFQSRPSSWL